MMDHKNKKGECRSCGLVYDKEIYSVSYPDGSGYESVKCPECGFSPVYKMEIFQVIDSSLKARITSSGIMFNKKELSEKVNGTIIKIWPKKEKLAVEINERDRYKKGECEACQVIYAKEVENMSGSNPNDWGYFYKACPNCYYHPEINEDMERMLGLGISAEFGTDGKIVFDIDGLSDLIIGELVKYWPKPKKKKL
jgi:hypothetical protein